MIENDCWAIRALELYLGYCEFDATHNKRLQVYPEAMFSLENQAVLHSLL
jgi:hypothetical protein